ncbi:unnamed protein product [Tilletia controversa]|nr:unnamed protein product [Tilletia controversa]CAD6944074.1 unnamed protein product [Tilletia controversa]
MAYRVEYASTGRAGCKGPKGCKDSGEANKIPKGALRFGTVVDINGNTTFMWRHFGCITDTICGHLAEKVGEPADLDGYEDLTEEDQKRIDYIFEHGAVPEAEVTPALREETKRKEAEKEQKEAEKQRVKDEKAAAKQKVKGDKAAEKQASTPKKRKKADVEADEEVQQEEETKADDKGKAKSKAAEPEEEAPPAKKRGRPAKAKQEQDKAPEASASTSTRPTRARAAKAKQAKADEDDGDEEDDQSGQRQPVDAFLEHILVTVSFAPTNPSQNPLSQQQQQQQSNSSTSMHSSSEAAAPSSSQSESQSAPSHGHQMTIALECFLYTVPAHRAAILYVSKLDSTGLGPSCPKSGHVPFMSEEVEMVLEGQATTTEGNPHPSTTLTRAVTTAFISYFASFQHWLPFSSPATAPVNQDPFPFPPRLEKTLAARREALEKSPVRHLSVHVLARAQRCYLFPDSNLNPSKRVLSDGGLIRWWRRTLSDAIFATRFEHTRAVQESGGSGSDHSPLTVLPFYLIPGYSKYESHPIVPLPAIPNFINDTVAAQTSASSPRKAARRTDLHPSWPIPPPGSHPAPSHAPNAPAAIDVNDEDELMFWESQAMASTSSPTHGRSISPLWEKLGKLDERASLTDARWTYGHPYSLEGTGVHDPTTLPVLPLYHPVARSRTRHEGKNVASAYDSAASTRGWRSIATLLPHFEDDPKSRFVDEIVRDAHEHGGPSLLRATAAGAVSASASAAASSSMISTKSKSSTAFGESQVVNGSASPLRGPTVLTGTEKAAVDSPEAQAPVTASSLRKSAALRSQMVERVALDNIPPTEFWERMGFRQECCAGNAVGVFVVLFTLEEPLSAATGADSTAPRLLPATPPAPQPLSLPHPSIPDMVMKNIMRDACDWSNGPSAEKLTQTWGEAVHKAVMRKGNVRRYLATGRGGGDTSPAPAPAMQQQGVGSTSGGGNHVDARPTYPSPLKRLASDRSNWAASDLDSPASPSKTPVQITRSSARIAIRESQSPGPAGPSAAAAASGPAGTPGLRTRSMSRTISLPDVFLGSIGGLEGSPTKSDRTVRNKAFNRASPSLGVGVRKMVALRRNGDGRGTTPMMMAEDDAPSTPGTTNAQRAPGPAVRLQDAPTDEPAWIGYNTIWTTVALHGPPAHVVSRAEEKLKVALAEAEARSKMSDHRVEDVPMMMVANEAGTTQGAAVAAAASAAVGGPGRSAQPVTLLAVKKKKKPNP